MIRSRDARSCPLAEASPQCNNQGTTTRGWLSCTVSQSPAFAFTKPPAKTPASWVGYRFPPVAGVPCRAVVSSSGRSQSLNCGDFEVWLMTTTTEAARLASVSSVHLSPCGRTIRPGRVIQFLFPLGTGRPDSNTAKSATRSALRLRQFAVSPPAPISHVLQGHLSELCRWTRRPEASPLAISIPVYLYTCVVHNMCMRFTFPAEVLTWIVPGVMAKDEAKYRRPGAMCVGEVTQQRSQSVLGCSDRLSALSLRCCTIWCNAGAVQRTFPADLQAGIPLDFSLTCAVASRCSKTTVSHLLCFLYVGTWVNCQVHDSLRAVSMR
jgi:hypothetical protein